MTYQPTCPPRLFLSFNFIPHLWNEKLTGSLPVRWISVEGMFPPRDRQPEARAPFPPPPLRHCYSQPRRPRILVFRCSSRFHAHMDSFTDPVNLSRGEMPRSCLISRRFADGWLGNHLRNTIECRGNVGDLFDSIVFPCFECVVFRSDSVDDLKRIWSSGYFKT